MGAPPEPGPGVKIEKSRGENPQGSVLGSRPGAACAATPPSSNTPWCDELGGSAGGFWGTGAHCVARGPHAMACSPRTISGAAHAPPAPENGAPRLCVPPAEDAAAPRLPRPGHPSPRQPGDRRGAPPWAPQPLRPPRPGGFFSFLVPFLSPGRETKPGDKMEPGPSIKAAAGTTSSPPPLMNPPPRPVPPHPARLSPPGTAVTPRRHPAPQTPPWTRGPSQGGDGARGMG